MVENIQAEVLRVKTMVQKLEQNKSTVEQPKKPSVSSSPTFQKLQKKVDEQELLIHKLQDKM